MNIFEERWSARRQSCCSSPLAALAAAWNKDAFGAKTPPMR